MNNGHASYSGPNFCPNCGCNVRAVAMALKLTEPAVEKPTPRIERPAPPLAIKRAYHRKDIERVPISREMSDEIFRRLELGEPQREIALAVGMKPETIGSHIARRKHGQLAWQKAERNKVANE